MMTSAAAAAAVVWAGESHMAALAPPTVMVERGFRLVPLEVKSKYFFCSPESISQPDLSSIVTSKCKATGRVMNEHMTSSTPFSYENMSNVRKI